MILFANFLLKKGTNGAKTIKIQGSNKISGFKNACGRKLLRSRILNRFGTPNSKIIGRLTPSCLMHKAAGE
jgi:hypothetical protein